jgi:hypothetical protein
VPCNGDACQGPAPAPEDPVPGTATLVAPSNPPLTYPKVKPRKQKKGKGKKGKGKKGKAAQKKSAKKKGGGRR